MDDEDHVLVVVATHAKQGSSKCVQKCGTERPSIHAYCHLTEEEGRNLAAYWFR